jgi:hypothetical protein
VRGVSKLMSFAICLLLVSMPSQVRAIQTVYTGSVVNSLLPNSPATLTITIYSDNGQRLAGQLLIGTPLGGSGPFTGSRSGDSLYVVTHSASGDTIVWISPSSGAILVGNYWITGGPYKGQSGRWSAQSAIASPSLARQEPQVAVEIVDQSSGIVGERLLYYVRETFRRSAAFRLTDVAEPRMQVIVSTMPRFEDQPNTSTMYSVVWTLVIGDATSGWTFLYLDNTIGYAGSDVVSSSAETIVARTDRLVASVRQRVNSH